MRPGRDDDAVERVADVTGGKELWVSFDYTIGKKVRPSMLKDLEEFGIQEPAGAEEPAAVPAAHGARHVSASARPGLDDPEYGSSLKHSLLESTARGASFIPSLATGTGGIPVGPTIKPRGNKKAGCPNAFPEICCTNYQILDFSVSPCWHAGQIVREAE